MAVIIGNQHDGVFHPTDSYQPNLVVGSTAEPLLAQALE